MGHVGSLVQREGGDFGNTQGIRSHWPKLLCFIIQIGENARQRSRIPGMRNCYPLLSFVKFRWFFFLSWSFSSNYDTPNVMLRLDVGLTRINQRGKKGGRGIMFHYGLKDFVLRLTWWLLIGWRVCNHDRILRQSEQRGLSASNFLPCMTKWFN